MGVLLIVQEAFCFQDVRATASSCCLCDSGFSHSVFLICTEMLKCITGYYDLLDPARRGAFSTLRAWTYDWISHTWEIIRNRLHKSDWANLDFEHLLWFFFSISSVCFSISRQIKVFSSQMAWLRIKMNGERLTRQCVQIFFLSPVRSHFSY